MQEQQTNIQNLFVKFETALTEYGFGYATRLRILHRAHTIVRRHEINGKDYFDGKIISDYYHEIDDRLYNGKMSKDHNQTLHREVGRFLQFAEHGTLKLPNLLKGCRQTITPDYEEIAENFLSGDMHPNTRNDIRWITYKYFAWLKEKGFEDLHGVGAREIQGFLLDCSKQMAMNSMRNVRLYLAKLYAYLYSAGLSDSSYKTLLSFKTNRESKVYPILQKKDIAKMLESIDRTTKSGKRAYAVMILGTVLGLRACDVIALKLTDIDWLLGEIKFVQSKTGKTIVLPLTTDVGEAVKDYILNARPKTDAKQIFMKLKAPITPIMSAVTIGEIFRDCCKNAGVPVSKQFHSLRRSLATSMVTNGVSVYDVAQGLGDSNIDSVKPYISLDSVHLKRCALSFDGISPLAGGDNRA
jgi:site-specific recombinase XerD